MMKKVLEIFVNLLLNVFMGALYGFLIFLNGGTQVEIMLAGLMGLTNASILQALDTKFNAKK